MASALDAGSPVDPYLFPARGRKRHYPQASIYHRAALIPTFSPQGDGNLNYGPFLTEEEAWKLIPTFSPQGDGNSGYDDAIPDAGVVVDPYLFPARGRKLQNVVWIYIKGLLLIPTFSPQGDGNG